MTKRFRKNKHFLFGSKPGYLWDSQVGTWVLASYVAANGDDFDFIQEGDGTHPSDPPVFTNVGWTSDAEDSSSHPSPSDTGDTVSDGTGASGGPDAGAAGGIGGDSAGSAGADGGAGI
jgi:hypothetical protein